MADEETPKEENKEEQAPEAPKEGDAAPAGDDAGGATSIEEMVADAMSDDEDGLNLESVYEIPVQISVVLGKTVMPISQLLKLGRGAVVELDRKVGDAVDIYVNDRLIARGEVVIVEDKIGITMTEIIKAGEQTGI
jgi:flagellar motor switch protein FliN/FliY